MSTARRTSPPAASVVAAPVVAAPVAGPRYVGLATRAISFALDAAVINLVATIVGVGAALIGSLLRLPPAVRTIPAVLGGIAYLIWLVGYFAVFWSTTGQTPGARIMQIRVLATAGETVGLPRAVVRCVGIVLATVPLFAGFVPVLLDDRRRALQDRLAGTVVVQWPQPWLAAALIDGRTRSSGRGSA